MLCFETTNIEAWKSEHAPLKDSMIGRYEGRFLLRVVVYSISPTPLPFKEIHLCLFVHQVLLDPMEVVAGGDEDDPLTFLVVLVP